MANNIRTIEFKEKGLREIQSELANVESSLRDIENNQSFEEMGESIEDASIKADELSSELSSVNEQLENAPNPFDNLSKSFKGFTSAVGDGNIPEMTKNLNGMSKAIGSMDFKTTIKGIGGMGKAFASVGKSLLVNPLFLLGTALGVITLAIIRVMDNMGILEDVLKALSAPMRVLIGLFDHLTDAIGLTNNAEQKLAETRAKAIKDGRKDLEDSTSHTIKMIDRQIERYRILGKSIDDLMIKRSLESLQLAQDAQRIAADDYRSAIFSKDVEVRNEALKNLNEANKEVELLEADHANIVLAINVQNAKELEKLDIEERDSGIKRTFEKGEEKVDSEKATSRLILDNKQKQIDLMKEGEDKELKQLEFYLEKQRILIEESGAKKEVIEKALTLLDEEETQRREFIKEKYRAEEEQKVKDFNTEMQRLSLSDKEFREQQLLEEHSKKLENYAKMRGDELISQAQYDEAERLLAEEHKELLDDLASSNMFLGNEEEEKPLIEIIEEQAQLAFEHLEELREKNLISEEEYADKVKEVEKKKNAAIKTARDKEHKEYIKILDEKVKASQQVFNSVGSLFSTMMDAQINAAEGNEAEQERIRERQFKAEQAFALVNVAINTAMATMKIMADTPTPAAPFVIAGNIAMGIAQMAAIASQKYSPQGGGGGGISSPPRVPTAKSVPQDSFGDSPERGVPNIDFFGTGSGDNDVNADGSNNGRGDIIINNDVRVSESEITNAQRTVINLDELNEL